MKSIIFNTETVKTTLEGRKTQARRLLKPQPVLYKDGAYFYRGCFDLQHHKDVIIQEYSPYKPGDILCVKETWRLIDFTHIDGDWSASVQFKDGTRGTRLHYLSDDEKLGWRSSTHMPKEAARIFLRVVDVRVERLQDITNSDCAKEGLDEELSSIKCGLMLEENLCNLTSLSDPTKTEDCWDCKFTKRNQFKTLWNSLNAKRGYPWESNPWVFVYTFEKIEKP